MIRRIRPGSVPSISTPDRGGWSYRWWTRHWRSPLALLIEAAKRSGDVIVLEAERHYLVNHPSHIKHVLLDNNRNYHKDRERFDALLGRGLLTSDGVFWRGQRRAMQPAFHRERIASATTSMTYATSAMLERWRPFAEHGQAFDLVPELMRLTVQIVGQALFSTELSNEAEVIGGA